MDARIAKLPQYRCLPIPFTVLVGSDGVPDFKVTDMDAWARCAREKLCGTCGEPLDYWVWCIGSKEHAEQGLYFDPPMHEACARFSAAQCPFIALGKGYAATHKPHEGFRIIEHGNVAEVRNPPTMWFARARRDQLKPVSHQGRFFIKVAKIVELEQIERQTGEPPEDAICQ